MKRMPAATPWKTALVLLLAVAGQAAAGDPPAAPGGAEDAAAAAAAERDALAGRFDATLRAFRGVAAIDWASALELLATPDMNAAWKRDQGRLFATPIESEAFFAQAITLTFGEGPERFTGGLYNLWLDQWLLLDFTWLPEPREYRVTAYAWLPGGDSGSDPATLGDAKALEQRLQARLDRALSTGRAALRKGAAATGAPAAAGREAVRCLQEHVRRMRGALAPEGAPAQAPLRAAVRAHMEQAASGRIPVFFTEQGVRRIVVFADPAAPFELTLVEFDYDGRQMILRQERPCRLSAAGGAP